MRRLWSLLFLTILCAKFVGAQQLPFEFVGDKLRLPAYECYNVMQDRKGYIWVSTEAGLCRYNGSSCKIFDKRNGLPENATYVVKEDKEGNIWLMTSANRILVYSADSLKEAPFSKSYQTLLRNNLEQGYFIDLLNDTIMINSRESTYAISMKGQKVTLVEPENTERYNFIRTRDDLLYIKSPACAEFQIKPHKFLIFSIRTGATAHLLHIPFKSVNPPDWRVLKTKNSKGEFFISIGNILLKLNKDLSFIYKELPCTIIDLYCDKDDDLWVGTIKGGIYHYEGPGDLDKKTISLPGFSVSGTCVDRENGVWCSTIEKGVFYCRNKNVVSFENTTGLNKPADLLKNESGKVYLSTGANELIAFKNDGTDSYKLSLPPNSQILDLLKDKNSWIVSGMDFVARWDNVFSKNQEIHPIAGSQVAVTENGRLFSIQFGCVFEIEKNSSLYKKTVLPSPGRCLFYEGQGRMLCGCRNGLYRLNISDHTIEKIVGLNGTVTKIFRISSGEIWIATKGNGLFKYKNDTAENISSSLHLPTDLLFDITEDRFHNIWIASNTGLIKLWKTAYRWSIRTYNTLNGLPTDKINKIAADSSFLYLSGITGIYRFPLNTDLFNSTEPAVYINAVSVNDVECDALASLKLSHDQNSLKIILDVLTFKEMDAPLIYYTLSGQDHLSYNEDVVKGNQISFDNLVPDTYELKIFGVNSSGVKSSQPAILHFQILKPFWQTAWFIVLVALGICIFIYIVVKGIISKIRTKEEEKTSINKQLAEFQLTALQAQMNPHFIFNAINSVQRYILERSKGEAYDYLAKFGKLIRIVLNNSEERVLSLQQELEMLKLYVELEQLRFNNSFEFKLIISENVNLHDTMVPTMLIQPYIENAIWHGLMNLNNERKGILKLEINVENDLLKIIIEDNGIGRKRSDEYKSESVHRPVAMKLNEMRLLVINRMKEYENARVAVTDLPDDGGTRVVILLPLQ